MLPRCSDYSCCQPFLPHYFIRELCLVLTRDEQMECTCCLLLTTEGCLAASFCYTQYLSRIHQEKTSNVEYPPAVNSYFYHCLSKDHLHALILIKTICPLMSISCLWLAAFKAFFANHCHLKRSIAQVPAMLLVSVTAIQCSNNVILC